MKECEGLSLPKNLLICTFFYKRMAIWKVFLLVKVERLELEMLNPAKGNDDCGK